jgi:hypothetical protein
MWIAIDYYSHERNCLENGLQNIYKLVEMLVNVRKEWPTLAIWLKQVIFKSNQIHFKNEYLGKPIGLA